MAQLLLERSVSKLEGSGFSVTAWRECLWAICSWCLLELLCLLGTQVRTSSWEQPVLGLLLLWVLQHTGTCVFHEAQKWGCLVFNDFILILSPGDEKEPGFPQTLA